MDPVTTTHRVRAVLKLKRKKILVLLAQAWALYTAMLGNPQMFPNPNPALPALLALIQALEAAAKAAATRTRGTIETRTIKRDELVTGLESERMYVQSLCDAKPERALAILAVVGMLPAQPSKRQKPVLEAKQSIPSAPVMLIANARLLTGKRNASRVTFFWQMSADGGKTWTELPATPLAKTIVGGLTPMTTYAFRVRVTVSQVAREWTDAVTLLVR